LGACRVGQVDNWDDAWFSSAERLLCVVDHGGQRWPEQQLNHSCTLTHRCMPTWLNRKRSPDSSWANDPTAAVIFILEINKSHNFLYSAGRRFILFLHAQTRLPRFLFACVHMNLSFSFLSRITYTNWFTQHNFERIS
jgi:hypothetical protein